MTDENEAAAFSQAWRTRAKTNASASLLFLIPSYNEICSTVYTMLLLHIDKETIVHLHKMKEWMNAFLNVRAIITLFECLPWEQQEQERLIWLKALNFQSLVIKSHVSPPLFL